MDKLVITDFLNANFVSDKKGNEIKFKSRYSDCFIMTLSGKVSFSFDGGCIVAQPGNTVFLPEGLAYTNRCLEEAQSYVFNFLSDNQGKKPEVLSRIPSKFLKNCYETINRLYYNESVENKLIIFRELYTIAAMAFTSSKKSGREVILADAVSYMAENYHNSALTVSQIAEHCHVSEIYLRKLFEKSYSTTPFRYLRNIRMNKAYQLTLEKRRISQIAIDVGYSDVYQFSRAFKKHFGFSPSEIQ